MKDIFSDSKIWVE